MSKRKKTNNKKLSADAKADAIEAFDLFAVDGALNASQLRLVFQGVLSLSFLVFWGFFAYSATQRWVSW